MAVLSIDAHKPRSLPAWAGLWAFAVLFCLILFGVLITPQNEPVLLPAAALVVVAMTFLFIQQNRGHGTIPCLEIGTVYVGVVTLYGLFPLLGYVVRGLSYGPDNDHRLFMAQPSPHDVGTVAWYYPVYAASFVLAYLLMRGRAGNSGLTVIRPDKKMIVGIIAAWLLIKVCLLSVGLVYDLSYRSYLESYLVAQRMPLPVQQIYGHLRGAAGVLEIAVLVVLFRYYVVARFLIIGWLLFIALSTFMTLESRTALMITVGASLMLYHHLVHRLRTAWVVLGGILVVAAFTVLGILRSGGNPLAGNPFAYNSEFEALFGNAHHLWKLRESGALVEPPAVLYFSDFLAVIPQQLLPFTKVSPSVWYLSTFFPEFMAQGGGLAFGAIPEALIGWGWPELILKGACLGLVFAAVHRFCVRRPRSVWIVAFYVWLTLFSFLSFRTTTFYLLAPFAFQFLPAFFIAATMAGVLKVISSQGAKTLTASRPNEAWVPS